MSRRSNAALFARYPCEFLTASLQPGPLHRSTRRHRHQSAPAILALAFGIACTTGLAGEDRLQENASIRVDRPSPDQTEWLLETPSIRWVLAFSKGRFQTKSLVNKKHSPAVDYSAGSVSPEFSFLEKGTPVSGVSDEWTLVDSQTVSLGDGTSDLNIVLKNKSLQVTRRYRLYPETGIVREWSTITNISEQPAELGNLSFFRKNLGQRAFGKEIRCGYFSGTGYDAGAQQLIWEHVSGDYRRDLSSSYGGKDHMPLIVVNDPSGGQGVFVGWDYLGPWVAEISAEKTDSLQLQLALKDYRRTLRPGEQIETPQAFMGVFAGDIDDMGNGILDWQYQYYWQHKHPDYWARPRLAVDWPWSLERNLNWIQRGGTSENWAYWLHLDLYFTDLARYAGAGNLWNDAGWYDEFGSWNGPDFGEVNKYLKKHGMSMIVWFPTHLRYAGCDADRSLSDTVQPNPGNVIDQTSPKVTEWQKHLLDQKVAEWGDFQWRWDVQPGAGSDPLAADQQQRKLTRQFLTDHPNCAIDAGSGGGASWFGIELAGYACASEMTDGKGVQDYGGYYSTLMALPDMLHWIILAHHQLRKGYSINNDRAHLRMHPVWYADPGTSLPYQNRGQNTEYQTASTLAVRPASIPGLENLRRDWDLYRYFLSKGVAGRWCHVFRPRVEGDHEFLYFQRMNRDGAQGVVLTTRLYNEPERMPDGQVVVYPKGLIPDRDYDVRFDFDTRVFRDSGGSLMTKGIAIPKLQAGEIIFLNLADHPGSHTDKVPPSPPSNVTKRVATNVYTQGVEVSWDAGKDDRWVSCYEIFRIAPSGEESSLGKVAQGTFFFDRSLPAYQLIKHDYQVRTLDGDGNVSERVKARQLPGEPETHFGFSGFGNRPAFRGWSCEATVDGLTYKPLRWEPQRGYEGRWAYEQDAGVIGRTYMRAHPSAEIARVFTVRRPGRVVLEGTVKKDLPPAQPQSEDCDVRMMKNGEQVWPPTEWARVPLDRKGISYQITIDVKAGDRLVHMMKRTAAYLGSGIDWNPVIRYAQ